MAEWFMPYATPQPIAQEAAAPVQVVVPREWDPNNFLICSHCGEPINHGEEGMELTPGVAGFGSRSGRPMFLDVEDPSFEHADLHIGCIYDYVFQVEEPLSYQEEEDSVVCHLCGENIPDSFNYCSNCGAKALGR